MLFFITTLLILASFTQVHSEDIWSVELENEINFIKNVDSTLLIVGTDENLLCVNQSNGATVWTNGELKKIRPYLFNFLPQSTLAIVTITTERDKSKGRMYRSREKDHNKFVVLDYSSGDILWKSDKLEIGSFLGHFPLQQKDVIMICVSDTVSKFWMIAVNFKTGEVLWENKDFFASYEPKLFQFQEIPGAGKIVLGNQPPLFDTDSTMITFMNVQKMRKWNSNTGELIWEASMKARKAPSLIRGYPPMFTNQNGENVIVASKKTVYSVNKNDGKLVWKTKIDCSGQVLQLQLVAQGLLVRAGGKIREMGKHQHPFLLDMNSGELIWKQKKLKLKTEKSSNFLVDGDRAIVYSDKKLFSIDLDNGLFSELAKDLKFKGKEHPASLLFRDDKYFLVSAQNAMMVDKEGYQEYHSYFKAPKAVGILRALAFMGNLYLTGGINMAINESAGRDQLIGFPKYGLTTNTKDYLYVSTLISQNMVAGYSTSNDYGWGLVKVDKSTGQFEDFIVMHEKNPIYAVDKTENFLFYAKDKTKLVCGKF